MNPPKYDTIGKGYNQTRRADPYLASRLLHHLSPIKSGYYLDIGCGTGNYTHALQQAGYKLIGIDPSSEMLNKARARYRQIDWQRGTAESTGLADEIANGITAFLTIHHWTDLNQAFRELYRVLKPAGKIVIFTSTPQQMRGYWLNHYFPVMLEDSTVQMPALERIEKVMADAGFLMAGTETYAVRPDLQDQFLYVGKNQPELYFDENIRRGISSFSALARKEEVKEGLAKLRKDINSGAIRGIIESYENSLGDYLYIIGQKEKK